MSEEEMRTEITRLRNKIETEDASQMNSLMVQMRNVESAVVDVRSSLARVESDCVEVKAAVTGSADPSKGLIVRVDRLEQTQGTISRALWVVIPASIVGAVKVLWEVITKR